MLTFLRLLGRLPLSLLYGIGSFIYGITYGVLRWRLVLSLGNLRNALPDKTDAERRRIARLSYRNLGELLAEVLKGATISEDDIRRRVHILNPELITHFTKQNRSVVLLASHHCNWEWLLLAAGATLDVPVDAVFSSKY